MIDFARFGALAINFLAKSNAGFPRIGGCDSLRLIEAEGER
jgi:hypothetical protein